MSPSGCSPLGANALITLKNVAVRVSDQRVLNDIHWQINSGEDWVIQGPNGAGKTTLAKTLAGQTAIVAGSFKRHPRPTHSPTNSTTTAARSRATVVALFSPEDYHRIYAGEQRLAEMRSFSGRIHETTTAAQALELDLTATHHPDRILQLTAKPIHALSSGELRELFIIRTIDRRPDLLVLDEPFNGLDSQARQRLFNLLETFHRQGGRMVLVVHRPEDIPAYFSHTLYLEAGRIIRMGPIDRHSVIKSDPGSTPLPAPKALSAPGIGLPTDQLSEKSDDNVLIRMQKVTVIYDRVRVLDRVTWVIRKKENWAVIGPNGAGKTTLLRLITGENLQAYANDIILFGQPKGSGETIWQIRNKIGYVADELQARYQRRLTGLDVVISGFFESVGIYRTADRHQIQAARNWLSRLDIAKLSDAYMNRLSFGQQRLLLIARAMVKQPQLLILDEPCNGLDRAHREKLLNLLDRIAHAGDTQLIYISHRHDEFPSCISHYLLLENGRATMTQASAFRKGVMGKNQP